MERIITAITMTMTTMTMTMVMMVMMMMMMVAISPGFLMVYMVFLNSLASIR